MKKIQQNRPEKEKKETSEIGYVKPREIVKEMEDSYTDYAMSVIVSRALPDVRDGLKPVHRRILYAMNEMGLTHGAKFRKSANVVGRVMGDYHPHGDMAIYDALVRMAQDFSLRYPLVNGQGNFGSIDNDPPAAQRYCISGDSLVVTNRCLERIDEVSKTEDVSLKVLSFGGKVNNASKLFDSGIHPVIEAKTRRGYSLRGTLNHPILVLAPGLNGAPFFKWKLLSEIKKGDFAVIDRNDQVLWPKKEPLLKRFYPKTKERNFKIYKLPIRMDENLAFLMGAIVAEGYVSISRDRRCGKIGFCNTDKEFSDVFRLKFKKLFPKTHICEQRRKPLSSGKKEFNSFEICFVYLVEFFHNLGIKMVPPREKQVPHIIFHSTKKSVAAFLRGFVEGDGSITILKERRSPEISFISVSKKLLQEIQLLLLRFGIDSFLRLDKNKGNWILTIRGKDNIRFFNEIGFVSALKKEKLKKYNQVDENYHAISKTDFIPFLSDYLRSKYKKEKIKWVFKDWLIRHNIDRYSKIRKYHDFLSQFLDREDLLSMESFTKNHYLFDKIESIKSAGTERVYSFRVDSQCHSFISNGFISHNTECRLSKYGDEMMLDIEKNTVNYTDNYDGSKKEPLVLPSPLPQLLLNGSLGIAVGMATNIPTHNLTEISDAMIYLLDNPKATTEDLLKYVKGPDFPTGGIIYDQKGIVETYSTGKGSIVTRGKADIVEEEKSNRHQIIITEIPFQVQKSSLIEQFANLVQEKKIEGIKDIRDESDKDGMRIVIDLHKEAYPAKILNRLYKFTDLQKSFHLNMLALVNGVEPRVLALNDLLSYFISHRKEVVYRRTKFDLDRAKERVHILEGFKICLDNIDAVIKLIRGSENKDDAKVRLIKRFKLTEIQALAILEMRLHQLAKLERSKIEEELNEKLKLIKELMAILKSPEKIKEIIKKEIIELRNNFGDSRRTKVINQQVGEIAEEDLIPDEETVVTLTHEGYIKRINPTVYKIQHRGGKGLLGMKTMQDDIVEHFLSSRTHDSLMFFTDSGKVFRTAVYEIPEGTRVARGRGLLNFLEISPQDRVLSLFTLNKADHDEGVKNLIMVTRNGIVKKTVLDEFNNVRRSGLIAITLKKGDSLKKVTKSCGNDDVILVTKKGQAIRFEEKEIREMGRPASGVKGIRLKKNDEIMGMEIIAGSKLKSADLKDKNAKPLKRYLLVVMDNGYGKKTEVSEYRSQGRGGGGIKTANVNAKTGDVIASWLLTGEEEDLIVISQKGQVIRTEIKSIPVLGRATQGVRIMRLDEGDKVASATCI